MKLNQLPLGLCVLAAFIAPAFATGDAGPPATQKPPLATPSQICDILTNSYTRALLGTPVLPAQKDAIHNALVGLSATVARHQTLERLLTIAWSRQCDLGPIIELERTRINQTYPQVGVQ